MTLRIAATPEAMQPTLSAERGRHGARRTALALALALCLTFGAGCSALKATLDLCAQINRGGGQCNSVSFNTVNGDDSVVVNTSGDIGRESNNVKRIAQITWTSFPYRFDGILISRGPGASTALRRPELERQFEARPPRLDEKSLTQAFTRAAVTGLAVAGGVGLVCVALVVVLVIVLVRRSRRNKSQGPPPGQWGGPPSAWAGPQPAPSGAPTGPPGPWGAAPPASAPGPWNPAPSGPWQAPAGPGTPADGPPPADPWGAAPR